MNVLPFVMTLLMILSIMTYARIESFQDLSGLKAQFEWYMQHFERKYSNEVNDRKYDTQNPSKRKIGEDPDTKQKDEEKACSRIPFYLFLNKQQREARHDFFDQHYLLAKLLMMQLYGDTAFLKKASETQPDIIDGILKGLINAAEKLPKGQTITSSADLASINLGDDLLNNTFTLMLKGTVEIDEQDEKGTYPPLTKFVTVKNKLKVRIFLAPHDILMAIYDNPALVKEIEETRISLYKQVKDESITKEEASKEFESQFSGKQREGIDSKILDFRVSKTNPKDY
jgi:hypothetical protein